MMATRAGLERLQRGAHNPKEAGSTPAPATTTPAKIQRWLDDGRLWDAERLAKESM